MIMPGDRGAGGYGGGPPVPLSTPRLMRVNLPPPYGTVTLQSFTTRPRVPPGGSGGNTAFGQPPILQLPGVTGRNGATTAAAGASAAAQRCRDVSSSAMTRGGHPVDVARRSQPAGPFGSTAGGNNARQGSVKRKKSSSDGQDDSDGDGGVVFAGGNGGSDEAVVGLPSSGAARAVIEPGTKVHAVYPGDGYLYPATVVERRAKQGGEGGNCTYIIDWDDGAIDHRERRAVEVFLPHEQPLVDMRFFRTPPALKAYVKGLDKKSCAKLCSIGCLSNRDGHAVLQKRLLRAVSDNFQLMQLATVCFCWVDIKEGLKLQGNKHPDFGILRKLLADAGGPMECYAGQPGGVLRLDMELQGHLPRFVPRKKGSKVARTVANRTVKWTPAEELVLAKSVGRIVHGEQRSWADVAAIVGGVRTAHSCRHHWHSLSRSSPKLVNIATVEKRKVLSTAQRRGSGS
jgi:hypothetical protein